MNYKIFVKNIDDITDDDYNDILNKLNLNEKKRIRCFSEIRLKQYLASRILLNKNNIDINNIHYNENGKPFVDNIKFSISHCDKYVVVVFSGKNIGIDIEKVKDYNHNILKILKLKENTISNRKFFVEYTRREALIKMLGLKLSDMNIDYDSCRYKSFIVNDYVISICISN